MLETENLEHMMNVFRKSDIHTLTNFLYTYDSATNAYKYAHNGNCLYDGKSSPEEWNQVVKGLHKLVPDGYTARRIKVQIYKYEVGDGLFGGGESGFVFSVDGKILGWTKWDSWVS